MTVKTSFFQIYTVKIFSLFFLGLLLAGCVTSQHKLEEVHRNTLKCEKRTDDGGKITANKLTDAACLYAIISSLNGADAYGINSGRGSLQVIFEENTASLSRKSISRLAVVTERLERLSLKSRYKGGLLQLRVVGFANIGETLEAGSSKRIYDECVRQINHPASDISYSHALCLASVRAEHIAAIVGEKYTVGKRKIEIVDVVGRVGKRECLKLDLSCTDHGNIKIEVVSGSLVTDERGDLRYYSGVQSDRESDFQNGTFLPSSLSQPGEMFSFQFIDIPGNKITDEIIRRLGQYNIDCIRSDGASANRYYYADARTGGTGLNFLCRSMLELRDRESLIATYEGLVDRYNINERVVLDVRSEDLNDSSLELYPRYANMRWVLPFAIADAPFMPACDPSSSECDLVAARLTLEALAQLPVSVDELLSAHAGYDIRTGIVHVLPGMQICFDGRGYAEMAPYLSTSKDCIETFEAPYNSNDLSLGAGEGRITFSPINNRISQACNKGSGGREGYKCSGMLGELGHSLYLGQLDVPPKDEKPVVAIPADLEAFARLGYITIFRPQNMVSPKVLKEIDYWSKEGDLRESAYILSATTSFDRYALEVCLAEDAAEFEARLRVATQQRDNLSDLNYQRDQCKTLDPYDDVTVKGFWEKEARFFGARAPETDFVINLQINGNGEVDYAPFGISLGELAQSKRVPLYKVSSRSEVLPKHWDASIVDYESDLLSEIPVFHGSEYSW